MNLLVFIVNYFLLILEAKSWLLALAGSLLGISIVAVFLFLDKCAFSSALLLKSQHAFAFTITNYSLAPSNFIIFIYTGQREL